MPVDRPFDAKGIHDQDFDASFTREDDKERASADPQQPKIAVEQGVPAFLVTDS